MTLFEHLTVLMSIILSLGMIRLLGGLPHAAARERRYWVHLAWVVAALVQHLQYWWVFWSYNVDPEWTFPRFLVVLASPLVLYSLSLVVVPDDPASVTAWRDHFERVRRRQCVLWALWFVVIGLANVVVLGQPLFNGVRAAQGAWVVLFAIGAWASAPGYHGVLIVLYLLNQLVVSTLVFSQPAPLSP